jgi:hypothetical protein
MLVETEEGPTVRDARAALDTVKLVVALSEPVLAVSAEVPMERDVTRPEGLIDATRGLPVVHAAVSVTSFDEPSLKIPVAVTCIFSPRATLGVVGATVNLES